MRTNNKAIILAALIGGVCALTVESKTTLPKQLYTRKDSVPVELTIFIPQNNLPNPADGGTTIFEGDNRTFNKNATSFRCRQKVTVVPVESLNASGLKPGSIENLVGTTRKYDPATSLDSQGNLTAAARADMVQGPPMMLEYGVASNADMHVSVTRSGARRLRVMLQGSAANPLVFSAPAIDWNIIIDIDATDRGRPKYTVTGSHDGFPAYELYLFDQRIYAYDPVAAGETPLALFPPMDKTAGSSGDIQ